jgi:uncharacterized protein
MALFFTLIIQELYKLFNDIINIILLNYPDLLAVYLYGSYAKGTNTENSDIDICVLMPTDTVVHRLDEKLNNDLTWVAKKDVHVVFCTQQNEWCLKELYKKTL